MAHTTSRSICTAARLSFMSGRGRATTDKKAILSNPGPWVRFSVAALFVGSRALILAIFAINTFLYVCVYGEALPELEIYGPWCPQMSFRRWFAIHSFFSTVHMPTPEPRNMFAVVKLNVTRPDLKWFEHVAGFCQPQFVFCSCVVL